MTGHDRNQSTNPYNPFHGMWVAVTRKTNQGTVLNQRLQHLLDLQDQGEIPTPEERKEAEGLVALAEMLSLLKLRARRVSQEETP